MSIQLVTYANQTVTPTNDAIIYEKAIDQNGIFYGCNVTVTSNTVNITGGYGIVCGREFVINSESIAVTLAPSGTLEGRLYVRLDLADADAPIQLLTATGNTLPPLVQDADVNYTNGTYEMELATFTVGVSSLSDVAETFEEITGTATKVLDKLTWKQLTNKTISSSSQREDISSYVDEYDELLFVCKQASGTRHYAPILIPTALMKSWANGTMYFETGAYASATAHNGIRFLIAKSGSTYKIGVEWNFFEGTANNTYVSVLGK